MTLRELIHEEWTKTPDAEPEDVAERVIGSVRTRADLAVLVFPAVRDQAVFVRRGIVRGNESASFNPGSEAHERPNDGPRFEGVDPTDARRALLASAVYVNHEEGYVTWGQMTAEQHGARIDFLERKIWGIARTADRHRLAVKLLEEHDAPCLDDLPDLPDTFWEDEA